MAPRSGESAAVAAADGAASARLGLRAARGAWATLAWLLIDMGHPLAQLTVPASSH